MTGCDLCLGEARSGAVDSVTSAGPRKIPWQAIAQLLGSLMSVSLFVFVNVCVCMCVSVWLAGEQSDPTGDSYTVSSRHA